MKKNICIVALMFMCVLLTGDADVKVFGGVNTTLKVVEISENNIVPETKTELVDLETQVNHALKQFGDTGDIALIGHSQGGVRALGVASVLSSNNSADRIKALITIASPVKGYSPLLAGKDVIVRRARVKYEQLDKGVQLVLGPSIQDLASFISFFSSGAREFINDFMLDSADLQMLMDSPIDVFPGIEDLIPGTTVYTANIYNIATDDVVSGAELLEFQSVVSSNTNPGEQFFNKYIEPSYMGLKYAARVQTGSRTELVQRGPGSYIEVEHPIYKTFTAFVPAMSEPKIASNIPIGFIVAYENDPFELEENADTRSNAKVACDVAEGVFFVAECYYNTLRWSGGLIHLGLYYKNKHKAEACARAKHIVGNPTKTLGDILGSPKNDCFILEEDQSRPLSGIGGLGGTPIDPDQNIRRVKAHHLNEPKHKDIWGGTQNGDYGMHGDSVRWTEKSIVGEWLKLQNINNSSGVVTR